MLRSLGTAKVKGKEGTLATIPLLAKEGSSLTADFNRRRLIRGAMILGIATIDLMRPLRGWARASAPGHGIEAQLVGLIHSKQAATRVGSEYLRQRASEADRRKLTALLIRGMPRPNTFPLTGFNTESLKSWLNTQQREDFYRGCIVDLQGWRLSVTEARLYALVALSTAIVPRQPSAPARSRSSRRALELDSSFE